jgi:hypothetical protein
MFHQSSAIQNLENDALLLVALAHVMVVASSLLLLTLATVAAAAPLPVFTLSQGPRVLPTLIAAEVVAECRNPIYR